MLVLSKKILITSVKIKPAHSKWRKHDTRGNIVPVSHLLWFAYVAYGLYMTTATLLNGHLYTIVIVCIPAAIFRPTTLFRLSLSRNLSPKIMSAFIVCCIYLYALRDTFDHIDQTLNL